MAKRLLCDRCFNEFSYAGPGMGEHTDWRCNRYLFCSAQCLALWALTYAQVPIVAGEPEGNVVPITLRFRVSQEAAEG